VRVIEVKGVPHALTQKDGNTFRLLARQEKTIEDTLISDEFRAEEKMGEILLIPEGTSIKKSSK
jgi:hypothetical protein